ncbi:MAG: hypothetical protein AAF510_17335, partial [Pseudomonadota bacterium]
ARDFGAAARDDATLDALYSEKVADAFKAAANRRRTLDVRLVVSGKSGLFAGDVNTSKAS